MERFDAAHNPLDERVSDEELRELLERLGEAQFGGDDRATVGAVVEGTGADAATVLRLLHEIRRRALDAQRASMTAMERRVSRLEGRTATSAVEPSEANRAAGVILMILVVALLFCCGLMALTGRNASASNSASWSVGTDDGKVVMDGGGIRVERPDGTTREPTPQERSIVSSFAESSGGR